KNIGINSRNFLIPDGVINLAYKAENSTATSPDGATIPFSSAEYALVNDSDLIRLNVSPIDNSAFTKFVFNLSKLNIFSRDVINLTYALQGYYSGDLAQTKYKFHTSWLTGENMNTVEQYYVRSFSGLSLSGVIRDGVFQLGTAQQNTSVGEDYTFINYVYVNVTYRLPLQIAYAGFFRDEWKDEDFLGKEAEDNLFLNSRSAYAGNSIELVYGRGRMPPYKIIYALVRDWEEIAISSLAQVDKWRIELAVEPIQINQARHMRSDTHSVNGLNTYKLGTTVSDQPVYIQGDCTDTGSFYLGIRVWRRLSNQTEIEITNGVAVGIVSLLVGRTEIVTTLSSTWQAPNFSLDPTDSLVIRVYGGLSTPPTSLLATFTTEILGAHKLLSSTWKINYRVRRIVFDNPPTSCFDFLFGTSQNDSYVENLTYELSPIWLNYSYNWEGSEVFMARTISLITNFTEIHKEGGLANKLEVESGTPYSVLKVIVRGLRSMDLNLPENTSLSINCEVLDLLDRKLGWSISISPTILVNSSYQDFNVCNITIPEIVNIQKYRVNVTLSNLTYSTSKYGISEFYLFKPAYIKLYLAR
ncbi:MAG: hypothetical protein QXX71_03510, partial [Candidatus Nanoarchaeia archaeon]|nr:hypothetical protein [Candidatus Haiyanarchaeum thermophilum]